jgi:hypothetical protein
VSVLPQEMQRPSSYFISTNLSMTELSKFILFTKSFIKTLLIVSYAEMNVTNAGLHATEQRLRYPSNFRREKTSLKPAKLLCLKQNGCKFCTEPKR